MLHFCGKRFLLLLNVTFCIYKHILGGLMNTIFHISILKLFEKLIKQICLQFETVIHFYLKLLPNPSLNFLCQSLKLFLCSIFQTLR